jgi:cytochrome c nitrite reductase small subunit
MAEQQAQASERDGDFAPESLRPGSAPWRVRRWLVLALAGLIGTFLGIGAYTFRYAEGLSYFSTAPVACVNCHIMRPQYDAWQKASHHTAAVCIDCHLPHDFFAKYVAKAENGYRHSRAFTLQDFEEPIYVKERGREILQENCVRCHAPLVAELGFHGNEAESELRCVHCHAGAGHGETGRLGGRLLPEELEERP